MPLDRLGICPSAEVGRLMAGLACGLLGFVLLLIGVAFSVTITAFSFGLLFLVAGVILLASSLYSRETVENVCEDSERAARRYRRDMRVNAAQLNRRLGLNREPSDLDDAPSRSARLKICRFADHPGRGTSYA
jgi:predicted lipid-binding transport protein (Tim44 family)